MTHGGNESVVSMPSEAADLLQKGAHAVFSSRTLQLLLTRLPYLPAAENLPLFQQGWCKCIPFLHRLTIQLHSFLFWMRYSTLSCLTGSVSATWKKKTGIGPRLKDAQTSRVQGK